MGVYMDDKHKKAKEVYTEYQKEEPHDGIYEMMEDEIISAADIGEPLYNVVENTGKLYVSQEPKHAVSILEAMYEALQQESEFITQHADKLMENGHWDVKQDREILVNRAINAMYNEAQHAFQDTADILQNCYPDIIEGVEHTNK